MNRLSVVIANFNYAEFLPIAVESALALRWSDLEVVVVDDGSTDGSLAALEPYVGRIRLIATANRGQREAVNLGLSHVSGDVVVFLDSDDVLPPDLPVAIHAAMRPGVSKVQFQMQRIDGDGTPFGTRFPAYRPPPSAARIRRWMLRTTAYPTPPASGNAYARWFLDRVMPLGPETGDFADSGLLAAAPLLGDVVAVAGVTVGYRRHRRNDSLLGRSRETFFRECDRAQRRWDFALRVSGRAPDPTRVFRSREVLQFRAAASRLTPERQLPGDGRGRILLDAVRSPTEPGPEPVLRRLLIACWSIAVVVVPPIVARELIGRRFARSPA